MSPSGLKISCESDWQHLYRLMQIRVASTCMQGICQDCTRSCMERTERCLGQGVLSLSGIFFIISFSRRVYCMFKMTDALMVLLIKTWKALCAPKTDREQIPSQTYICIYIYIYICVCIATSIYSLHTYANNRLIGKKWLSDALFPGITRPGRKVNHETLSIAEAQNEWSYTSTLSVYLNGADRDNFTFTFVIYSTNLKWKKSHSHDRESLSGC
jgi:hypothetical protein